MGFLFCILANFFPTCSATVSSFALGTKGLLTEYFLGAVSFSFPSSLAAGDEEGDGKDTDFGDGGMMRA